MKARHRRTHAAIWPVLGPVLLVLVLWATWSRPVDPAAAGSTTIAPTPTDADDADREAAP